MYEIHCKKCWGTLREVLMVLGSNKLKGLLLYLDLEVRDEDYTRVYLKDTNIVLLDVIRNENKINLYHKIDENNEQGYWFSLLKDEAAMVSRFLRLLIKKYFEAQEGTVDIIDCKDIVLKSFKFKG